MHSQLVERDDALELALELHVDDVPGRCVLFGIGIVVVVLRVEGAGIRITFAGDADDAGDARYIATGIVEKRQITLFYRVAQHVARLVITYAVPRRGLFGSLAEIIDAEGGGFRFEQPIIHRKCSIPDSVANESNRRSQASANFTFVRWQSNASPTRCGPFQQRRRRRNARARS